MLLSFSENTRSRPSVVHAGRLNPPGFDSFTGCANGWKASPNESPQMLLRQMVS